MKRDYKPYIAFIHELDHDLLRLVAAGIKLIRSQAINFGDKNQ